MSIAKTKKTVQRKPALAAKKTKSTKAKLTAKPAAKTTKKLAAAKKPAVKTVKKASAKKPSNKKRLTMAEIFAAMHAKVVKNQQNIRHLEHVSNNFNQRFRSQGSAQMHTHRTMHHSRGK